MTKVKISSEQERIVKEVLKGVTTDKELGSTLFWVVRYHICNDYEAQTLTQITAESLKDFSTPDIVRILLGDYEVEETALDILKRKYKKAKENTLHIESRRYVKGVEDTLKAFNLTLEEEK